MLLMMVAELQPPSRSGGRPLVTSAPSSPAPAPAVVLLLFPRVIARMLRGRRAHAVSAHTEALLLVLQPDGLSAQLGAVEQVEGVLRALGVLEHDEGEVLLPLGLLVARDGDALQRPRVLEQLVQDLLVNLLGHAAAPQRAQLLLVNTSSAPSVPLTVVTGQASVLHP